MQKETVSEEDYVLSPGMSTLSQAKMCIGIKICIKINDRLMLLEDG